MKINLLTKVLDTGTFLLTCSSEQCCCLNLIIAGWCDGHTSHSGTMKDQLLNPQIIKLVMLCWGYFLEAYYCSVTKYLCQILFLLIRVPVLFFKTCFLPYKFIFVNIKS
jgi:hypothetical protein